MDVKDLDLDAASQDDLFRRVAHAVDIDEDAIVAALTAREAQGSTAIDDGIAFPHAEVDGLDHAVLVDVRLERAVSWDEIGFIPAEPDADAPKRSRLRTAIRRCLCVLVPRGDAQSHNDLLAEAARRSR